MIDQLRDGDFVERQNPAYELLCRDAGEVKASPAFFLVLPPLDTMRSSNRPTYPYKKMTFAARNQHRIYWGPLKKPLEWSLKTWLAPWAYVVSVAYHDVFWYPLYGKPRIEEALPSEWGRLFANWGKVKTDPAGHGYLDVGSEHPELVRMGAAHFAEGMRLVDIAVIESPRFTWP
jgi:hypothetical protein